ncbi:MAG TPA: lysylphosphatidylglycerol synthase transmembrane domain-containing protein [Solirubrobacteraceae bacterium]|jgi:uncharacterized membrane protein YbhN (UPF0104 family)|nr:lysylphosphatidylglycerol synthase transmembrane domain-containing protein [Solirubrobacteraceae bacterium]
MSRLSLRESRRERADPPPSGPAGGIAGEYAAQSRRLRNGLISLGVFFALVLGLLFAVPDLRAAIEHMTDAGAGWMALAIVFQALSCAGYAVFFVLVFPGLGRRLSLQISLSEMAVNSIFSVSGIGGLALGAWIMRSKGIAMDRIARRSVVVFLLTSAVNTAAMILIGVPMWLGLLPGTRNPLLTALPAAVALGAIIGTLALAEWAGRAADRRAAAEEGSRRARVEVALSAISEGVGDSLGLLAGRDWRLLGAVGYWLFNNLVLYACLMAFGGAPSLWVVGMAYLTGMIANAIPIPGGLIAVEGGLVGMLVLFGVGPTSAVFGAVVAYRAITLWIPAVAGSVAFLSLRGEIGTPLTTRAPGAAGL